MRITLTGLLVVCALTAAPLVGPAGAAELRVNVAAAANGATATASSTDHAGYAPSTAIDGERRGIKWGDGGGWKDKTRGTFPDWLEVAFAGSRTIDQVAVFSLQDAVTASIDPTPTMTFTKYGVVDFSVQYWTGTAWQTVSGGTVAANNLVWRTVTFPAVTTSRIRILVQKAVDGTSRIIEVEAYGTEPITPPATSTRLNVAAAASGATAAASSTDHAGYAPGGAINGDRRGINWGDGGGWKDKTGGTFPDWLEVSFAGARTIDEVAVFSLQDAPSAPVEPTPTMTFTKYGLVDFTVEYWTGTSWQVVSGGAVAGNSLVWRSVLFPAVTTSRIRVMVSKTSDGRSRVVEVEAYEAAAPAQINAPPTVSLTAPTAGATFTAPASVEVSAIAGDSDGSIAQVGFYVNDALIGTDNAAPYSVTWSVVAAGSYEVRAVATDNAGATTSSSPHAVTVTDIVQGTEWFVAPGGTGSGTSVAPFGKIQSALDVAQPGDTITIRPGTYNEAIKTVRNGAAGQPIRVRAEAGHGSVLVTVSGRVLGVFHAYVTVDGVILDGQYGVSDTVKIGSGGHYFTLRNSEVRRSTADLIDMSAPHGVLIEDSLIHHALNAANGRTDAHGIVSGPVQDLTVRRTEIHTFSGDGLQVDPGRSSPGWNRVTIEDCVIWLAPLPSAENGFAAGTVPGENAVDTKSSPSLPRATMTIRNSVFRGYRNGLIGNMAALNLKENVEVRVDRVTVYDSEIAFRLRGPTSSTPAGAWVTLTNAVVHDTATAFRYENEVERAQLWNVTLGRNVTRSFQAASSSMAGLDVRNLLSMPALTAEAAHRSNMQVTSSAFVDAAAHDYRLAAGAPAIDTGDAIAEVPTDRDGVNRPQGSGYDVGAYERRIP